MWDKTYDSGSQWFHMNGFKKRTNANAFYSPGVDRIFAVDAFDPYTAFEVAIILSGKVPGISVCILDTSEPWLDNSNCHKFTLKDKSILSPGSSVLFNRQIPLIRRLPPKSLIETTSMPLDYTDNENYSMFLKLQEYTKFVIQAWHSAKLCEVMFNFFPMETYAKDFLTDELPKDFSVRVDSGNAELKTGITKEIKKILYLSNSSDEALISIKDLWKNNTTPFTVYWRDLFYKSLELPVPDELSSAEVNIDQYSGWLL
jgi:hypothetical protein